MRQHRTERMVELRSRGLTLEAIGQRFGLTRERVRQIVNPCEITRRYTTFPDLMARFGVGRYELTKAIEALGLDQSTQKGRRFVFSAAEVAEIVRQLNQRVVRQCRVCGGSFEVGVRSPKQICSAECQKQRRQFISRQEMRPTTQRIHDLLVAEPPGSTWVTLRLAALLSGMSRNQLSWLRWRGLIAYVPSKMRSRSGRPRVLYSARHCELLHHCSSLTPRATADWLVDEDQQAQELIGR